MNEFSLNWYELNENNYVNLKENLLIELIDKSIVKANDVKIKNAKYTIAVYQKKPEYGKSSLIVTNFTETEYTTIIEKDSMLTINGVSYMGDRKNVYGVLYGETA